MVFVNREPQIQQLELTIVPIEKVSSRCAVLPSPPHILPQSVERIALLGIPLGIIAVCLSDVPFQRRDPVYLGGLLQGTRYHGLLQHN